jgi:hypothetical protein
MKIKNTLIGIAIAILTFLVIFTGIQTFFPQPDYGDFCKSDLKFPEPQKFCTQDAMQCPDGSFVGRDPNNNCEFYPCENTCTKDAMQCPDGTIVGRDPNNNCEFYPCENEFYECNAEYEKARSNYSRNLFIITTILGVILLAIGGAFFTLEIVGSGIMGGGIITLLYGAFSYWPNAGNLFRFIISIIGLALVIGFGYWLNRPFLKNKKIQKRK